AADNHLVGALFAYVWNRTDILEFNDTVKLGKYLRFRSDIGGCTTHVECTEGKLGSRLTDRLRSNYADSLAFLYTLTGCKVPSITQRTDTTPAFTSQYRADFQTFYCRVFDFRRNFFVDILIGGNQ